MNIQSIHIINFLVYLAISLPLVAIGVWIFVRITPYNEVSLIREGNQFADAAKIGSAKAAAHDLGGKVLGLAIVLASAIFHSVSAVDLLIWGIVSIIVQVIVFLTLHKLTPLNFVQEVIAGNEAVGIFSSRLSISIGLIIASLISY